VDLYSKVSVSNLKRAQCACTWKVESLEMAFEGLQSKIKIKEGWARPLWL